MAHHILLSLLILILILVHPITLNLLTIHLLASFTTKVLCSIHSIVCKSVVHPTLNSLETLPAILVTMFSLIPLDILPHMPVNPLLIMHTNQRLLHNSLLGIRLMILPHKLLLHLLHISWPPHPLFHPHHPPSTHIPTPPLLIQYPLPRLKHFHKRLYNNILILIGHCLLSPIIFLLLVHLLYLTRHYYKHLILFTLTNDRLNVLLVTIVQKWLCYRWWHGIKRIGSLCLASAWCTSSVVRFFIILPRHPHPLLQLDPPPHSYILPLINLLLRQLNHPLKTLHSLLFQLIL